LLPPLYHSGASEFRDEHAPSIRNNNNTHAGERYTSYHGVYHVFGECLIQNVPERTQSHRRRDALRLT
jgi:hypothetical protein